MPTEGQHRLFFALWPERAAGDALYDLAQPLQNACGGRVMARDSLHLTLAFLGDVAADRLAAAVTSADVVRSPAFALRLDRLGYWRHNKVLWAGCGEVAPVLADLAASLAASLRQQGFVLEERPFAPHVTLLRKAESTPDESAWAGVGWPVREFTLVESRLSGSGSRYAIPGQSHDAALPPRQGEGWGGDGVKTVRTCHGIRQISPHPPPGLPLEGGGEHPDDIHTIARYAILQRWPLG